MKSLYDDLSDKLAQDPRLTKRGGPRVDLSLLLFNAREDLHQLWQTADRHLQTHPHPDHHDLHQAVEKLRAIFGER
ncbi:MAG: hypothetical protein H6658_17280 [Ardenticatenaceae bacterium]|nr:hypothetical protein [Ardenticatenaceae bacterium]